MFTEKADNPRIFDINLQLFSDSDPAGVQAGDSAGDSTPAAEPTTGDTQAPANFGELWDRFEGASQNPTESGEPSVEPEGEFADEPSIEETPEWAQNLPDKFKNYDGTVNYESLAKSYLHLEPELTRRSAELAQVRQQMQGQPTQQPEQSPTGQPAYSPEQITEFGERFMEDLLDPSKTIQTLSNVVNAAVNQALNQNVLPKINPLIQRDEYNQEVANWQYQFNALTQQNPEAAQLKPVMLEILSEPVTGPDGQPMIGPDGQVVTNGDYISTMPNAIQLTHDLAKARQTQGLKSPDEMLNDSTFWSKAATHPEIRKMVLAANAREVYAGNQQTPTVIGNQPAGVPPSMPPEKPRNTEEAGRRFGDWLKSRIGI